jgi:predicted oxidoreductase
MVMSDPGKVVVAVVFFVAVAHTITTIVRAWAMRHPSRNAGDLTGSAADARLSRLEQAVDAIALEIERISEGQRFTTKLLSEQARHVNSAARQLSSNTPI